MKDIRHLLEPQSVYDIQVFLGFSNFYWQFIQRFSRLAGLLTSILKMTSAVGTKDKNLEQDSQKI